MFSFRSIAMPLVVALLVAGCVGPEAEPVVIAQAPVERAASPPETEPTPAEAEAPPPLPPVDVAVDWDGQLGRSFCLPREPTSGACYHHSELPSEQGNMTLYLDDIGNATAADVTLTWDLVSPLALELTFKLMGASTCGEACTVFTEYASVTGQSPLRLDVPSLSLAQRESVSLHVRMECQVTIATQACIQDPQPFHVEGFVTFLPDPAVSHASAP